MLNNLFKVTRPELVNSFFLFVSRAKQLPSPDRTSSEWLTVGQRLCGAEETATVDPYILPSQPIWAQHWETQKKCCGPPGWVSYMVHGKLCRGAKKFLTLAVPGSQDYKSYMVSETLADVTSPFSKMW